MTYRYRNFDFIITNEDELQSEEKLKIILNRLKQECHKKDAFKYLKDWYNYSETKLIFLNYLEYHPRLCILLIEAGYVITGEMFLLTLKADIYDDRHIDDYFEVINAILKKLNLESNNRKKKDKFGFVGGEKSLRSESLSQCITNLTLIDHYKQTYLHYFIYEMSNR
ncbi:2783_t:CDS:1, partial [Rhizophagus irregularis]